MPVYDKTGNELNVVYSMDAESLNVVYDINGNPIQMAGVPDIIVMTYNAGWFQGINSQQAMQNAIINNNNADIIGFQEFTRNGSIPSVGQTALTNYQTIEISSHYNYNAMVSKSLSLSNLTNADYQTQYGETRSYMKCYIAVNGKTVCWINTHLCYDSNTAQYGQATELFTMAENEEYVIITGDLNSTALSTDDADYIGIFKQFVDAGYNLANSSSLAGFTKTWTDSTSATSMAEMTYPTDSIITSGNIDILSVKFDATKFSYLDGNPLDHIPVVAELRIN